MGFGRKKKEKEKKSVQPTSTESIREVARKESEYLFEPEKLKEEVKSTGNKLKEMEEMLSKISEFSNKLEEKKKELQSQVDKYKPLARDLTAKVDELSQRYSKASSEAKTLIERYKSELKEVIGKLEELENIKRELGKIKIKIDEIMSGIGEVSSKIRAYSVADGETVAKILKKYKDTRKWEEFKELLAYKPEILEAALTIGRDTGYEASQLLPIAAAYSLKKWDKKNGKPPAEIVNYKVDSGAVEKYLVDLSNQSQEAGVTISSYLEK
jgi:chromosome segregation ATPase